MKAKVYYKKDGMDFYLVSLSMPNIGVFINSIIVDKNKKGERQVKTPRFPYKNKPISHIEFDQSKEFWQVLEALVLSAVDAYSGGGGDVVIYPTDEELNNPEAGLDEAINNL